MKKKITKDGYTCFVSIKRFDYLFELKVKKWWGYSTIRKQTFNMSPIIDLDFDFDLTSEALRMIRQERDRVQLLRDIKIIIEEKLEQL